MYTMPEINLAVLDAEERDLAEGIVATRGPNAGRLRASKPPVTRTDLGPEAPGSYYHNWRIEGGKTAYIWRMVAFFVSPNPRHHSMPVTADFDLEGKYAERLALTKKLDAIVDKITNAIPMTEWHGVDRWRGLL